uniref:Uncharacterized protein n=1 Tax=Cyprinus carpio TaxID=7962 RepID=A0A8C2BZ17_CYPCA
YFLSVSILTIVLPLHSHRWFRRLFPCSHLLKPKKKMIKMSSRLQLISTSTWNEWVASAEVPKDAVSVKDEQKVLNVMYNIVTGAYEQLMNKDNFEMMECKKCTNGKLPYMFIEIFLTLNTDFKMQHLNVVEYLMSSVVTSETLSSVVKFCLWQCIGGKFGLKYDYSHSRSSTRSVVEKTLHSVSMEIPPNHSCTIEMTSNTFTAEVPFTGEMTRMYKNNEIHKTFISGTYILQEVAEIQTLVNLCQLLSEVRKC